MGGGGGEEGKSGTETDQQTRTHAVWSSYHLYPIPNTWTYSISSPYFSLCVFNRFNTPCDSSVLIWDL